ncbi:hypothetical protein DERA104750_13285 [Deinococcus radiodurans]
MQVAEGCGQGQAARRADSLPAELAAHQHPSALRAQAQRPGAQLPRQRAAA